MIIQIAGLSMHHCLTSCLFRIGPLIQGHIAQFGLKGLQRFLIKNKFNIITFIHRQHPKGPVVFLKYKKTKISYNFSGRALNQTVWFQMLVSMVTGIA